MLILTAPATIRHTMLGCARTVPVDALKRYAAMLDTEPIAWLYILQPGDTLKLLAQLRSQPFETWEYIEHHDGWFEAVFIISDDGFGHVVLVPDQPDSDPELLEMCRTYATLGEQPISNSA